MTLPPNQFVTPTKAGIAINKREGSESDPDFRQDDDGALE